MRSTCFDFTLATQILGQQQAYMQACCLNACCLNGLLPTYVQFNEIINLGQAGHTAFFFIKQVLHLENKTELYQLVVIHIKLHCNIKYLQAWYHCTLLGLFLSITHCMRRSHLIFIHKTQTAYMPGYIQQTTCEMCKSTRKAHTCCKLEMLLTTPSRRNRSVHVNKC